MGMGVGIMGIEGMGRVGGREKSEASTCGAQVTKHWCRRVAGECHWDSAQTSVLLLPHMKNERWPVQPICTILPT